MSEPDINNYKRVCDNCPNIVILTKGAMQGEVQLTFVHMYVGNKSLGEYVMVFALAGSLDSHSLFSININIVFIVNGDKISLRIADVLLRAAVRNFARSEKQQDWMTHNAIILPPFLTEGAILDKETSA